MSTRFIQLGAWVAISANKKRTELQAIQAGDGATLSKIEEIKLSYVKRSAEVLKLLVDTLVDEAENKSDEDVSDEDTGEGEGAIKKRGKAFKITASQMKLSIENVSVGILDEAPAEENSLDPELLEGTPTQVKISLPPEEDEYVPDHFRDLFFQKLGVLFYYVLSGGKAYNDGLARFSTDPDAVHSRGESEADNGDESGASSVSKMMRRMEITHLDQDLMAAGVPVALCRLVMDLINSGKDGISNDSSFNSLTDVASDLKEIIHDRPEDLFYVMGGVTDQLDYGNILFGRDDDNNTILSLAELVQTEQQSLSNRLVLIGARAGEGKTCFVEHVAARLVASNWLYIKGKFDGFGHNSPFAAIASALETFFQSVLAKPEEAEYRIRFALSLRMRLSASLIIMLSRLVPSLRRFFRSIVERVIEDDEVSVESNKLELQNQGDSIDSYQEESENLDAHVNGDRVPAEEQVDFREIASSAETDRNRLHFAFRSLFHVISTLGKPLLFVLDDLHWAKQGSLDILSSLLSEFNHLQQLEDDTEPKAPILFIGTYRSDEVGLNHHLYSYIEKWSFAANVITDLLEFEPLSTRHFNAIISHALKIPSRFSAPLASVIYAKTAGNVFYMKEFLKSLIATKQLRYSLPDKQWVWDLEAVRLVLVDESVAKLLSKNISGLSYEVINNLKILSCLGCQVDATLIQLLPYHDEMFAAIEEAMEQNIIEKRGGSFHFAHDLLLHCVYGMIPPQALAQMHFTLANELIPHLEIMSGSEFDSLLFISMDQINKAHSLGASTPVPFLNITYARFNLLCAQRCNSVANYEASLTYATFGLSYVPDWSSSYLLNLRLCECASLACHKTTQLQMLSNLIDDIMLNARAFGTLHDTITANHIMINSIVTQGRAGDAVQKAFQVLKELGEVFPNETDAPHTIPGKLSLTKDLLSRYTKDGILALPRTTNMRISATISLMEYMISVFVMTNKPYYTPLLACRIIELSIEHGICSDTAFGIAGYASSVVSLLNDVEEARRWGKIALSMHKSFDSQKHPKLVTMVYFFALALSEPLQSTVSVLQENLKQGLAVGDYEFAYICPIMGFYFGCLWAGDNLLNKEKEIKAVAAEVKKYNQVPQKYILSGVCLVIFALSGSNANPFEMLFEVSNPMIDEECLVQRMISKGIKGGLQRRYFNRCFLAFWFKKYDEAVKWSDEFRKLPIVWAIFHVYDSFYRGLAALQLAKISPDPKWIEAGKTTLVDFLKWSEHSTWNYENKKLLCQAELYSLEGSEEAEEMYKASILSAQKHRFVHEEGLALESLGCYYLKKGIVDEAKLCMSKARKCYETWGAFAILDLRTPE